MSKIGMRHLSQNPYAGLSQAVWADACFVKNFSKLDILSPNKLKKLAFITHDIYSSFDITLRALMACDAKLGRRMPLSTLLFLIKKI